MIKLTLRRPHREKVVDALEARVGDLAGTLTAGKEPHEGWLARRRRIRNMNKDMQAMSAEQFKTATKEKLRGS